MTELDPDSAFFTDNLDTRTQSFEIMKRNLQQKTAQVDELEKQLSLLHLANLQVEEPNRLSIFSKYSSSLSPITIKCINNLMGLFMELNEASLNSIRKLEAKDDEVSEVSAVQNVLLLHETKSKLKRYKNELTSINEKYPWLLDKTQNLLHVADELSALDKLQKEKLELEDELAVYHNLPPNYAEAKEEINKQKRIFEDLNELFNK